VAIGARARDLKDLIAIHEYFLALLEKSLGYAVLVPEQLVDKGQPELADTLRCWLGLLDRAVTPQMLRAGSAEDDTGLTEALLRYVVAKQSPLRIDRDKTDLIATWLYKQWSSAHKLQPVVRDDAFSTPDFARVPEFAGPLYSLLSDVQLAELPEVHRQLLREFPFVYQEIQELSRFDKLMDSDLVQRVREIKESFGQSIYHPYVLAAFAECNVLFGCKFDELFHNAVRELKTFAAAVELGGGSLQARIDGDCTVKEVTQVGGEEILREEYEVARTKFRTISKLTKAVARLRGNGTSCTPAAISGKLCSQQPTISTSEMSASDQRQLEERVRARKEVSITSSTASRISAFVRAADPAHSLVVPLRKGTFILTPAERDAFCADYAGEKNFRGSYAATMIEIVSTSVRLREELEELRSKRKESTYLWMRHADTLAYVLKAVQATIDNGKHIVAVAEQRGLKEKVSAMIASFERLEAMRQQVSEGLQALLANSPEQNDTDVTKSSVSPS
jgi:hypothetical protein